MDAFKVIAASALLVGCTAQERPERGTTLYLSEGVAMTGVREVTLDEPEFIADFNRASDIDVRMAEIEMKIEFLREHISSRAYFCGNDVLKVEELIKRRERLFVEAPDSVEFAVADRQCRELVRDGKISRKNCSLLPQS